MGRALVPAHESVFLVEVAWRFDGETPGAGL
jgi:hypothetical protein